MNELRFEEKGGRARDEERDDEWRDDLMEERRHDWEDGMF